MSNVITDQQRADLEAQHGTLMVLETDFGDFAFRSASLVEFRRFSAEVEAPSTKLDAHRVLCLATVVSPGKEALTAAFEKAPGLIYGLGNEVAVHSGLTSKAVRKK
jgi:hypothetical protein